MTCISVAIVAPNTSFNKLRMVFWHANFNPKYAQYALTILRTYLNFCVAFKTKKRTATPAQRLGITEKQFSFKDIIYFK